MIYTMTQVCEETGMTYQGLKFYCNEGLVPNVKRDKRNRRVFDEYDLAWIKSLTCLRDCGMGIQEMKEYLALCLRGPSTIPERKEILNRKRVEVEKQLAMVKNTLKFIDNKQKFYDGVLAGKIEYVSNLIPRDRWDKQSGKGKPCGAASCNER
ncbi:MAG: MerR family transcriptional regulator [Synergistaceae bacterium]|nr:MerR family transcriptional regulator [Synergistaceae bacterium]